MATIRKVVGQITLKVIVDVESTTYFYLLMPSTAPAPSKPTTSPPPVYSTTGYDGWSETEPGYTSGDTRSLYITVRTIYTDGSFEYTTPSLSSSYEAAKEAYNRAQSALTLAGQINQSIWQQTTPYSASIPAGLYVTEVGETAFKQNPSGGNIILQSTGVTLRNGATQLASLTGSALNFYNPQASSGENPLQLSIGANGALQSGNYIRGNNPKFASSGTKIDLSSGDIITQYFRLSQGFEQGITSGAYIHGTIEALDGSIGSDSTNYWEIGNYTDYNLHETAKIIGHGSSFIQLGDSSTWRLATNRIHTGWHIDNDSWLHFPEYTDGINILYWDYGFHTPTSKDDKFIYIRTAPNTTTLNNLLDDIDDTSATSYWTYNFYIDGSGNIHAKNFYIGDSDTPIGGGTGTIAEKIINQDSTYGKGSTTQPVYIDSNGRVQVVGWSSETSLTNSNQKIPTSAAVKSFVEGKGYTTNTGTVTSVQVQASDPLQSSTASAQSTSLNTTISFKNQNKNVVLAGPATGSAAAPTFRALAIADIPDLSSLYLTSYTETDPTVPNWAKQSSKPSYSASEVGAVATSAVGAASGVAPLNASSKIDSTYLPSYVDDVIEGYYYNNKFWTTSAHTTEIPGEAGKIYVDLATNKTYRYGSSTFTEISQGSLVTVSRSLTSGTKSATITVDGTSYDLYAPSNTNTTYTLSNALASHKFTSTLTPSSGNATTATQEFAAGGAITLTDDTTNKKITIAHTDTSSQASSSNSGRTYIQSVTLDTYGHVTGLSTATETVTDTHYTANLITGASASAKTNAAATSGSVYLNLIENNEVRNSHQITGDGIVSVASDANGKITITGSAHPTTLPNPKSLKLKVYSGTSTSSDTTYYGGEANNTEVSVAGTTAITGISASAAAGGSTTFTLTKANGTTSTFDVTVTASVATGATKLIDSNGNTISEGSATNPVYFSAGVPVSTTYSLNKTVPSNAVFTDTWTAMVGATASANGSVGYINAVPPKDGYNTKFLRADGTWVVPGGTYSLPLAANGTRGGVQIGYTQSGKNYPVQLSSEKMYVNVPWENTTYSAGTGLSLSGTTFSNSGVRSVVTSTSNGAISVNTGGSTANVFPKGFEYGYVNTHPENTPVIIPFINNDIAHLLKRGGAATINYDNVAQTVDLTPIFDGSGSYFSINNTNITTVTIELTLHKTFTWTSTIYVDFGAAGWRAKDVKIEVINTAYANDTWTEKYHNTAVDLGHSYVTTSHTPSGASNAGGGFNKVRFTFTNFNSKGTSNFRISQIGIINYGSAGLREPYMSRGVDDYVFRNITPNNNNTYNLGSSSYKWANIYATTLNGSLAWSNVSGKPTATSNATTGISIAAHATDTIIGVQSTTTTASKVTVGSHSTDYGVKSVGSASTWTFEEKTIPNVTAAGSGSANLTFTMDTTDTKKLKITFSHTHTAPTIDTAIKVQSKSGGANGTAPTIGSKVPTVSASDVTVPIKNTGASTFVMGATHTVTDNGHTHTI